MEKKLHYWHTKKSLKKNDDNCPVCDKDLYWDEFFTQRIGVLDEHDEVEGWMCPYCRSRFDIEENITYISLPDSKTGKA